MGNDCFATRPNEVYGKYLCLISIPKLKEQWSVVQLYKIKKVFDSYAVKSEFGKAMIRLESLKQIFQEFYRYEDRQIQRIYEIFDFENKNYIDWHNFYTFITICTHAPLNILSLLMFMIFDESLAKKLSKDQLNLLVDFNAYYIRESSVDHEAYIYDPDDIGQILMGNEEFISIQKWQNQAHKVFDFEKYRKLFNIFVEFKMEKELIQNFDCWNEIFSQTEKKYISYIIDFKWFQLWKAYCFAEYGVKINSGFKNPNNTMKTLKSFKTKKTLKTLNSIKTEKNIINKALLNEQDENILINSSDYRVKNYNLIHSHIGSKPMKMFNQELQGEFHEVLAPQLVQNMNYTLVSQKVWKKLKYIYKGYPEFRRTGTNNIELYPKRIKIYSALFKNRLDYSSEIIREVPCYLKVQDLLTECLQVTNIKQKQVFFKTIGMHKWEELSQFSYMFTELTSEILIFLAYFEGEDSSLFKRNHCKIAQSILDVNLGDQIRYDHPRHSQLKKAIYMGQTLDGNEIIHFKGTSHIYDEIVERQHFIQKATIAHRNSIPGEDIRITLLDVPIIPIIKSFGFINSLILMLISNPEIKSILNQLPQSYENRQFLDLLANLYKNSKKKSRIEPSFIVDLVETSLTEFVNFEFGMIDDCYRTVMQMFDRGLRKADARNVLKEDYYFSIVKKIKCLHCLSVKVYGEKCYSFNIELPQNSQKYLEFTYVPFSSTVKSLDIKKYGLKMKSSATYKQYKAQVGKLIESENTPFVICEVYSDNIIRNFSLVKDETTLEELNLKETDNIFVYQLCSSLDRFVIDHYTAVKDITYKKFNKGDFIDCRTKKDQWIAGKIVEIEFMPYTQKTIVKVIHKDTKMANEKKEYELNNQNIAVFPTKSYLYSEQYHLKVVQRCYNEALNEMLPSNIPLVMVLTSWMRCKEFEFMVYQQLKCFIAENYRFKDIHEFDEENCMTNTNPKYLSYKFSKKQKIKRFKEYLMSDHFPYTISLLDLDGRCLVCHKIHKIKISKGESDYYCSGCKLNSQNLITWQIKIHNCMVCVDWHGLDRFKKNILKDHKSFTDMIMNKKNDIERLEKLIDERLTKKIMILQQQCCNFPYKTTFSEQIKSYPAQLVIQIERLIDTGTTKSINRKHINFPFDDLKVGKKMYFLTGVISIEGTHSISYKNYISNESEEWFEVHGEIIKKVRKNLVQKCCALFLVYKMKPIQENQVGLSACQESDEFLPLSDRGNSSHFANSEVLIRNRIKKLTINQRLQDMEDGKDDFSYLDTEKEDQVELEEGSGLESDQDIIPKRSNSKRSAHYVKDSKELIKSVSECGKSSQDDKENVMIIRLDKSREMIGKSLKNSKSASNFESEQKKKQKQKITFELNHQGEDSSQVSEEGSYCNENTLKTPHNIKTLSCVEQRMLETELAIQHIASDDQNGSHIAIFINSKGSLNPKQNSNQQSSMKSIELQEISQKMGSIELIRSNKKINGPSLKEVKQSE